MPSWMVAVSSEIGSPCAPKTKVWATAGPAAARRTTVAATSTTRARRIDMSPLWMVGRYGSTIALRPDRINQRQPAIVSPAGTPVTPPTLVRAKPRVEGVTETVPQQVESENRQDDGGAREEEHPPRAAREVLVRVGQHRAPLERRRLGAETEEAQRGRLENGECDRERSLHDERRQAVREDVARDHE